MPVRVYPRACGGTHRAGRRREGVHGLSPRVRGNLGDRVPITRPVRSIPARAGEPDGNSFQFYYSAVYPRACGGTRILGEDLDTLTGLSPRVRGNRAWSSAGGLADWSIPARAGEPLGEGQGAPLEDGLSPRVRGNLASESSLLQVLPVYPRACGGNPLCLRCQHRRIGSIPARAGEPASSPTASPIIAVYPRACGGTPGKKARFLSYRGLSPRVRGNRYGMSPTLAEIGSIPARAGEPAV